VGVKIGLTRNKRTHRLDWKIFLPKKMGMTRGCSWM